MRLDKARIENFKCVEDSTEFGVDQVTCLMGKNEAGKTALMEALEKLNPVREGRDEFTDLEYPRRHLVDKRQSSSIADDNVVTTTWRLDDSDKSYFNIILGTDIFKEDIVRVKKGYENEVIVDVEVDVKEYISHKIEDYSLNAAERSGIKESDSIEELKSKLQDKENLSSKQESLLEDLNDKFNNGGLEQYVSNKIKDRIPRFLYFANYHKLPGRIGLKELKKRKNNNNLEFGDRIFLSLLDMTSSSLEEIENLDTTDRLIMELEGIQNNLTDKIFKYWTQNKNLEVEFKFKQSEPGDQYSGRIFDTRIYNRRHRVTVNFDERSAGFTWFFSFLIWFSQVKENYGEDVILLLDEPGLSLHGKAQQDLLRYINDELRPHHQVMYTAHSPFMIDTENIFSLRTVEDVTEENQAGEDKIKGTKVGDDIFGREEDTLFPLQGIVGFDMADTMFVGPHVLVVEGPSDAALIHWFVKQLDRRDRSSLDVRWAVCPAESASKVDSFISLFQGRGLNIAALLDFHDGQKGKVKRLENSGLIDEERVLRTTKYVDQNEADIEDLIGREAYIHIVNEALRLTGEHSLPQDKPEDADTRVVKEVERHCRTLPMRFPEFNHYIPVEYLSNIDNEEIENIPGIGKSFSRFESMFSDLNKFI